MTQSSSSSSNEALYRGTPYLEDLQRQMGEGFSRIVQQEVQRFKKVKQNLKTKIEESEGGAPKAKQALDSLPAALRHTGSYVAGPYTLPQGETTQIPVIVRSHDGGEYVVGYFTIHTTIGGTWQMVGYDGNKGRPEPLTREVVAYEPDDLEHAMGKVDSFIQTVDQVAGSYIQLDEQRSSGSVGMAGLIDEGVDDSVGEEIPVGDEPSSTGQSRGHQSKVERLKNRTSRVLTTGKSGGDTLIRHEREHFPDKDEVEKRLLKKTYRHAAPTWFDELKSNRVSHSKKWAKFKKIAHAVYKKVLKMDDKGDPKTINQFWTYLGRACKNKDLMSKNYCWTTSREIGRNENGQCTKRHECSRYNRGESGRCIHQSVKQ